MSKHTIRKDKTCLNCNYVVENRFCSNCGQENSDTRKSFYELFVHFFEDLTHYENSFWRTMKNLLLKPASLTKEYLSGKRMSYLAPIRLYIFISFVTFFLLSLLPSPIDKENNSNIKDKKAKSTKVGVVTITESNQVANDSLGLSLPEKKLKQLYLQKKLTQKEFDTLSKYASEAAEKNSEFSFNGVTYKSIKEVDSLQKFSDKKLNFFKYWLVKKLMKPTQNKRKDEILPLFLESFKKNIPKALFIYMPIFAFLLWLFNNKKRWYYFDHGIFTLHYFSFMLLSLLLLSLINEAIYLLGENDYTDLITGILDFAMILWFIYYFYRANKNFYGNKRLNSFLKSTFLLILNTFFMIIVLLIFILYSFITIH